MINTTNQIALIGLSTKIRKAPIAVPINGPNTGINAVAAIMQETMMAYGIRKMSMPIKQRTPISNTSVHCPATKLEKALFVSTRREVSFRALSRSIMEYTMLFIRRPRDSLDARM